MVYLPSPYKRASIKPLFLQVNGKTSGPKEYSGIIGNSIQQCTLPIAKFKNIHTNNMPDFDKKDILNLEQIKNIQNLLFNYF